MTYDPEKCAAFAHNTDAPFNVPANGEHRVRADCSFCGGYVQNYQVSLMAAPSRRAPKYATLKVIDVATGNEVGKPSPKRDVVLIGNVPPGASYDVVVMGGSKPEQCVLFFSGAI